MENELSLPVRNLKSAGVIATVVALLAAPAQAAGTDAILILDASGSMWGQVDGQTKISAARQAVDAILARWKPDDRLGLMAYGHRAKGDCKDIEMLVPVSRFDAGRIKMAVNNLNPKGKTPIADSLRAAAQALKTTETKASVVLVSDGIETCAPDPCAVAAELKKAGVGFTAHVIGFDVTDPTAKDQLQCIARATGGVYLDARNAATLETALGRAVEATQGGKVASEAPPRPARDVLAGKNLRAVARLADGLDPISTDNVIWTFFADDDGEKGDMVKEFYGAPAAGAMTPGRYLVEVQYGEVRRTFPATIDKGKRATLDVVLDAGFVTSEASRIGRAGRLDDVAWEVKDRHGEAVATAYDPVPRFVLPAGDYVLELSKGQAKAEKPFKLTAGDQINVELALDAGRLFVSGVYAAAGPEVKDGLSVEVRKARNSDDEPGESLATTYDALAKFELPSASYEVLVSVGQAARSFTVKVASGETTRLNAVLDAGVIALKAPGSEQLDIARAERDINGERETVISTHSGAIDTALNAGNYVAIAHVGNDRTIEKAFTVAPGKRLEIEVK
jgi:Ca-activated chloride channel family protein